MNKLKTGKGALKDYQRYLADEYDDYAEEPQENDPVARITQSNTYQKEIALQKAKTQKVTIKKTTHWPKYQPDFNFVVASGRIFEGLIGEKFARYLKVSDVVKLLRTCQYLKKLFSKTSIWIYYLTKSYGPLDIPTCTLCSIDIIQYSKYLRFARDCNAPLGVCEDVGMGNDGIVFDSVVIAREMMHEEEKYLARNIVDSVTVKSQKTIENMNKLALNGTLTGDMKISWRKDANQVCVWVAGYQVQNKNLRNIAGVLFKKNYDEESQLATKVYFLNDRYFVVELEEKSEEDGSVVKSIEVYVMEAEDGWFEKINACLCKQVLKQTFTEDTKNVQVKNIGGFFIFILEKEENIVCVQVFDLNGSQYNSEDLNLNAGLYDVISSKRVAQQEDSFSLYLVNTKSDVYSLSYNIESGMAMKKMDQAKTIKTEEEKQESSLQQNQRFSDVVKRYCYGVFKTANPEDQNVTIEYMMVYEEKQFYFAKFDTNELIHCDLPEYDTTELKFYNWTICGNYLYLLFDVGVKIYQLDYLNHSAVLYKKEVAPMRPKFKGSHARWIFVNPCMTIIMSSCSFDEGFVRSLELWIGSTQNLLMKVNPFLDTMLGKQKAEVFNPVWEFDECRLDKIFTDFEDKILLEKETIECKFEDERLLIQTNFRSYFRDFNVGEKRVNRDQYGWKSAAIYNLDYASALNLPSGGVKQKNNISFVTNLLAHENKNHGKTKDHGRGQNWKDVEKKADTEEKLEKKESRKKGDKYYKNVRQGKHRQKTSD